MPALGNKPMAGTSFFLFLPCLSYFSYKRPLFDSLDNYFCLG